MQAVCPQHRGLSARCKCTYKRAELSTAGAIPDAVELLHTEHWAQVISDLLQALLVLLMNHQEGHCLQLQQ